MEDSVKKALMAVGKSEFVEMYDSLSDILKEDDENGRDADA